MRGDLRKRVEAARAAAPRRRSAWSLIDWALLAAMLALTALLLLFRLGAAPIQLYDEALLVDNASRC